MGEGKTEQGNTGKGTGMATHKAMIAERATKGMCDVVATLNRLAQNIPTATPETSREVTALANSVNLLRIQFQNLRASNDLF